MAGSGPHESGTDDPTDPTDQVSGATPPLEDPVTGEPPVAPPIAPPAEPSGSGETGQQGSPPVEPGEPTP